VSHALSHQGKTLAVYVMRMAKAKNMFERKYEKLVGTATPNMSYEKQVADISYI
jgi:hypothetical protein